MFAREYELTYIVRPDVDDDETTKVQEKITGVIEDQKGTMLRVDDWGVRKLAYDIQKFSKGRYVLLSFLSDPEAIAELERTMRIDDRIMRFLSVKVEERVEVEGRIAEEATREAARVAAAATEAADDAGASA
ncbi:MAG: 30S ribosomal protein S6 [Proteobacteria bacterium]|nr:30S ribosomal protein S6 [Pseudomonadota bacterium]